MSDNKSSAIWNFFDVNHRKNWYATCLKCKADISRGPEGKPSKWGNGGMKRHLERCHSSEFREYENQTLKSKNLNGERISIDMNEIFPNLTTAKAIAANEIEKFFAMPLTDPESDPLDFYKMHGHTFPHLSKVGLIFIDILVVFKIAIRFFYFTAVSKIFECALWKCCK